MSSSSALTDFLGDALAHLAGSEGAAQAKASRARPDAATWNGAPAHSTTHSPVLDLFYGGMVRGAEGDKLKTQMRAAWSDDPKRTLQVLMHGRDCRGGKGERAVVIECLLWLRQHKPRTYVRNLARFVDVGYFKDLLQLAVGARTRGLPSLTASEEAVEVLLFAAQLRADLAELDGWKARQGLEALDLKDDEEKAKDGQGEEEEWVTVEAGEGEDEKKEGAGNNKNKNKRKRKRAVGGKTAGVSISLAAKWAPNEKSQWDGKEHRLAKRLAQALFPEAGGRARAQYRKFLNPLRTHLKVVERLMCAGRWDEIEFGQVPSVAHKRLKTAFAKHAPERYAEYLGRVRKGEEKINTAGLQPHDLVRPYLQWNYSAEGNAMTEEANELQWRTLVDKLRSGPDGDGLKSALAVVDVSGSMSGTPMEVAIALGLLVSELTVDAFKDRVITFHESPTWHVVKGQSLKERVTDMKGMAWGMSTDLLKVFEQVLEGAKQFKVSAEDMPKTLFIFSDMQFNSAMRGEAPDETTYTTARKMYEAAGFEVPQVVFWNLQGRTTTAPVTVDAHGTAMVSGFSAELLKLFMRGADLSPMKILEMAVGRYEVEVDETEV